MQNVNIHVLEGSGRLKDYKQEIESSIKEALKEILKYLELKNLDIIVVDDPQWAMPETGDMGYCPDPHFFYINLDPDFEEFESKTIPKHIKATVVHESHHITRKQLTEFRETLLEQIVREGLADNFQASIYDDSYQPWTDPLEKPEISEIAERFSHEKYSENYDHDEWFYGRGDLPRSAGYRVGFAAIRNYIQETGQTAAELVDEPAETFEESVNKVLGIEGVQNG